MLIAEFDGDRIRSFRQSWGEADLLEGLGLPPGDQYVCAEDLCAL